MSEEADTSIGSRLRHSTKRVYDSEDEPEQDMEEYSDSTYREPRSKKRHLTNKHKKHHNHSTRVSVPGNIDDIDDFEENAIFAALSRSETSISDLAADWIDSVSSDEETKKQDAIKDFVNFVLRSCGCTSLLKRHDVIDPEKAGDTISEVQELFLSQSSHEYPLGVTFRTQNPNWKGFQDRASEFVRQLMMIASERGILYDSEDYLDTITAWLGSMSTANERSMRYAATFYSLEIESALCEIYAQTIKFINRCQRQLTAEKRNLKRLSSMSRTRETRKKTSEDRIELINSNSLEYTRKKDILNKLIKNVFSTFFVHRYRDTNAQLRKICISQLGDWILKLPEIFLKPIYLRYIGWLLTDPKPAVRLQAVKALIPLYELPTAITTLRQFTHHFKETFITIALNDSDTSVRASSIELLSIMVGNSFLEKSETVKITSLLFTESNDQSDSYSRIIKATCKFVSSVEKGNYDDYLEAHGTILKRAKSAINLNVNVMLKFHFLCQTLEEAYDYAKSEHSAHHRYDTTRCIAENMFAIPRYNMKNECVVFLLNYLLFDFSSITHLDRSFKSVLELSEHDQLILLDLIYGITYVLSEGNNNTTFRIVMSRRSHKLIADKKDRNYYLVKVITDIPKLLQFFNTNQHALSIIVLTVCSLLPSRATETNLFRDTNQEENYGRIITLIIEAFANAYIPLISPGIKDLGIEGYDDSTNYPFGLFFKKLDSGNSIISIKLEETISGLHDSLGKSLSEDNISAISQLAIKVRLLSENILLAFKVRRSFLDQVSEICHKLSTVEDKSETLALGDLLSSFILGTTTSLVNCVLDQTENHDDDISISLKELSETKEILNSIFGLTKVNDKEVQVISIGYWSEIISLVTSTNKHIFSKLSDASYEYPELKEKINESVYNVDKIDENTEDSIRSVFSSVKIQYKRELDDEEIDESDSGKLLFVMCKAALVLNNAGLISDDFADDSAKAQTILDDSYQDLLREHAKKLAELTDLLDNAATNLA